MIATSPAKRAAHAHNEDDIWILLVWFAHGLKDHGDYGANEDEPNDIDILLMSNYTGRLGTFTS